MTDSRCSYCASSNTVTSVPQLLIITPNERLLFLSGDDDFANRFTNNNNSKSYQKYSPYKCLCTNGYVWNSARRRCYNRTLNATV